MALSKTDVINAALSLAEEGRVSSPTANDPRALTAEAHYDHVRRGLLEDYSWNFSYTLTQLGAASTAPVWKWSYAYTLPTDCLRIYEVKNEGRHSRWVMGRHQGHRSILTDMTAPLYIAYGADIESTSQWSALFTEAMVGKLGMLLAAKLGTNADVQRAANFYESALRRAKVADSQEGIPEQAPDPEWVTARVTGPTGIDSGYRPIGTGD